MASQVMQANELENRGLLSRQIVRLGLQLGQ